MYCIETQELSHHFMADARVLNAINLKVPEGAIYGFLGANGAGKTTTIRLLLGLLQKQSGSVKIFGDEFESNRLSILRNVGSLIESPSLYGHLTANENLLILQKIYQCPKHRIEEVLRLVQLSSTGKKKVAQFSLGMKQRLSLAMALLNEPKLMILDEPTNGLDPNGILEMRELLKQLNREKGTTIMVSSHLLTEVEKLVSHVGIIHQGSLLFQGTLGELGSKQSQLSGIEINTNQAELALKLISSLGITGIVENEKVLLNGLPKEQVAQINRELVQQGIDVYGISLVKNDLETIFMDLINN